MNYSKKKILLVTHSSYEYGGAEEGFDDIISYFSGKNDEYEIWSMFPDGKRSELYKSMSDHFIISEGAFMPVASRPLLEYYGFLKSFFKLRKVIKRELKGVYFESCVINVSVMLWHILLLRKHTKKLIVIVKETIYPDLLRRIVYRFLDKYCDFIFFVAITNKEEFDSICKSENKTGMTYSPLNIISKNDNLLPESLNTNSAVKKIFSSQKSYLKLICMGSLDERKNQLMIINAISKLVNDSNLNIALFLVGDDVKNSEYVKKIKEGIVKNKLNDIVFITGILSKDEYPLLLSKCDVMIISSTSEGLPIVLLEAFAYRKIVISTNIFAIKSVITDGLNGFLIDINKDSLISKLRFIIENNNKLDNVRNNAYNTYLYYEMKHQNAMKDLELKMVEY